MITTAMAVVVAAERERMWRALADPAEIVRWDESRTALVDRDSVYPAAGERFRWRSKLGFIANDGGRSRGIPADPVLRGGRYAQVGDLTAAGIDVIVEGPANHHVIAAARRYLVFAAHVQIG